MISDTSPMSLGWQYTHVILIAKCHKDFKTQNTTQAWSVRNHLTYPLEQAQKPYQKGK